MTSQMPPLILAEPDQPFWGFAEILLSVAVLLAALGGVIGIASRYLHAPPESGLWSVLEEAAAYAILFVALKLMFARYGKGVLESLGWTKSFPFSPLSLAVTGFGMSLILILLEYALRTPNVSTPFQQLLDDPASRIAVAIDAITLGPIVEELLFRGLLQPVLVSTVGVFPGILLTSALFGALHLMQNAFVWQSGVLIMIVGFVLGSIRHLTGSTKASTIVHMAYNSTLALSLVAYSASATHK
jgi:hypothetical protein